jgi:molybdopterin-guanine dinucleotide biosynthesis protein A
MSTAAILAGGRARRFGGRPKLLLPLGDRRIVDRLLAALRAVADQVFIVANDCETYAGLGVPVHPDVLAAAGPLGGVHAALKASHSARTLIVAGDMPFPSPPLLERLLHRASPAVDVAVPHTRDGYQPLCACYRASCVPLLERRIAAGTLQASEAVRRMRRHELGTEEIGPLDPYGTLFFNVNTPADYARALALAAYHDK